MSAEDLTVARQVLQTTFGLADFRPHQLPIITAALSGKDVLAVLATGGGKSICFQVPGLLKPGLILVITPLISLMKDQTVKLVNKGVMAAAWHSQLSDGEEKELVAQLTQQKLKFLYLSPEKLAGQKCQKILTHLKVDLLVIDEAHCLSLWGHDFRPSYLKVKTWLETRPQRPQIMALTATATAAVQAEICQELGLNQPEILVASSVRNNLGLAVYFRPTPIKKYLTVLTLLASQPTGTIMLYCATRGEVEFLARSLRDWRQAVPENQRETRPILAYHGGLAAQLRHEVQAEFLHHPAVIMVATNAFGMGIDKSNIRLIIHIQLPSNLENYAQEIGRAGRDGAPARTVLLVSEVDWQLQLEMAARQPNHAFKMSWLRQFILAKMCRQQTLATYFGETAPVCGQCDVCVQSAETLGQIWPSQQVWTLYQKLTALRIPYPTTLKFIALLQPTTDIGLQKIPGIGQGWIEKWGQQVLKLTNSKTDTTLHR